MLKKILVCALSLLLALSGIAACAEEDYQKAFASISEFVGCGDSVQEWMDGTLTENTGSATDGYVITLNRSGADMDCSAYIEAAARKLQADDFSSPVSKQRCALALISCGALDRVPLGLVDETTGALGVMSYVYGLHLLNNGAKSDKWSAESLAEELIHLQKADGGWAVKGEFGDVDVSSMCLQALSACEDGTVPEAVTEGALNFLSSRQQDSGGFSSYGLENCESAAQVLIALSSLGVNPVEDARFIRNGNSVTDAFMSFRRADGGFAHLSDESKANATACVQAYQALAAMMNSGKAFYDFSGEPFVLELPESDSGKGPGGWKTWALAAVGLFTAIGTVFALTRRRGRLKQLIFVIAAAGIAAVAILSINIESGDAYYGATAARGKKTGEVTLAIYCDSVAGARDDGSTPTDGVVLSPTVFSCYAGDSVFDILTDAARRFEIHMEYEGAGEMAYLNGINHLYEYDHGELSGWMYFLNGEEVSVGCGTCPVEDGDEIIWRYTTELGEDLK